MKAIRNPVTTRFLRLRSRNCALAIDEPTRKQMPRIINHVRLMRFQRNTSTEVRMGNPISGWLQRLLRPTIHSLIRAVLVRLLIGQRLMTRDSPHLNPLSSARREGRVRGGGNRKIAALPCWKCAKTAGPCSTAPQNPPGSLRGSHQGASIIPEPKQSQLILRLGCKPE
jgi:hypothetical protein